MSEPEDAGGRPDAPDDPTDDRRDMVADQLAARGIRDPRVLSAIARVPRHLFVPQRFRVHAHEDRALPIPAGQTISQPYMVGLMTEAVEVRPGSRVLEVGTGSGYQAAVLATLGARVFSVERIPGLAAGARTRLERMGLADRVELRVEDGSLGWPEEHPFEAILVTAGAPRVPPTLVQALARGGRLVIPVGGSGMQDLVRIRRDVKGRTHEEHLCRCAFVPLRGREGWPEDDGNSLSH